VIPTANATPADARIIQSWCEFVLQAASLHRYRRTARKFDSAPPEHQYSFFLPPKDGDNGTTSGLVDPPFSGCAMADDWWAFFREAIIKTFKALFFTPSHRLGKWMLVIMIILRLTNYLCPLTRKGQTIVQKRSSVCCNRDNSNKACHSPPVRASLWYHLCESRAQTHFKFKFSSFHEIPGSQFKNGVLSRFPTSTTTTTTTSVA
jgi:hypothetical protein